MSNELDRHLLFGMLALQNGFISRESLVAAVSAWLADKSLALDELICKQGGIAADERRLALELVNQHLRRPANDRKSGLSAQSSVALLLNDLQKLGDSELEASIYNVSSAPKVTDSQLQETLPPQAAGLAGDRYRVLRPHAEGGLGKVFVALDIELNREVALKEIKFHAADDPDSRARFVLEAEITGGLEHPGVVPVYGLGQYVDGRPFYAMRFIHGDNLKAAVDRFHAALPSSDRYETMEFRELLGRFIDVCHTVDYAHSRGVLHRDLKPDNIMLGKYGETLVVDWGLAKPTGRRERAAESDERTLQPRSASGSAATQSGSAIGSPAYMSPEQAQGRLNELTPVSDVYSLGATLYYVLTGQPPFQRDNPGAVLQKVERGEFAKPRAVMPEIPKPLEAVCLKAMATRSVERYASSGELAKDLQRFLADEPVKARPEPPSERLHRLARRYRRLILASMLILLVGFTLASTALAMVSNANQRARHALQQIAVLRRSLKTLELQLVGPEDEKTREEVLKTMEGIHKTIDGLSVVPNVLGD